MTRTPIPSIVLMLLGAVSCLVGSCMGHLSRQHAVPAALREMWPPIRAAAVREAEAAPLPAAIEHVHHADQALAAADPSLLLLVQWEPIESAAAACIERRLAAGELGPAGAGLQRDHLAEFRALRQRLR